METKRTIVVGDIHGCIEEFDELLRKVAYRRGLNRLVLLGDLIDRGPDGPGVIRRAREIHAECVLGNHDEWHIRWRRWEEKVKSQGAKNPMRRKEPSRIVENERLSEKDMRWLRSLPIRIELGNNWVAVHGGFQPGLSSAEQKDNDVIRMRFVDEKTFEPMTLGDDFSQPEGSVFWAHAWRGPENVMYGHAVHGNEPLHTVCKGEPPFELFREGWPETVQTLGLDTGCCFGGRLTAAVSTDDFLTWEIVQVDAKRVYREVPGGVQTMHGRGFPSPPVE